MAAALEAHEWRTAPKERPAPDEGGPMCPCARPGMTTERRGRSTRFEILMRRLQCEHDAEVAQLRAEIVVLRGGAEDPTTPPATPLRERSLAPVVPEQTSASELQSKSLSPTGGVKEDRETLGAGRGPGCSRASCSAVISSASSQTSTGKSVGRSPSKSVARLNANTARLRSYMTEQKSVRGGGTRYMRSLRYILQGPLEVVVGVAIFLNVVAAFVLIELKGRESGALIGLAASSDTTAIQSALTVALDAFTAFFALELILKLVAFGRELVYKNTAFQWFNIFDAAIVVLSFIDKVTMLASQSETSSNFALLRSLRLIRVLRVLRVARTLKAFASLRVLVSAVAASFFALFWSMVLLGVVMLVAALFLSHAVSDVVENPAFSDELREWAYRYYGTSSRAIWTVFELTFSGGWPNYARRLVEEVSPGFALFFACYVSGVTFGMFRIITALFLKDTLRVAALDIDNSIIEVMGENRHYARKLAEFFEAADVSCHGRLSLKQFDEVLADDRASAYVTSLGIDARKMRQMFSVLSIGSEDSITVDMFIKGAMSLRGQAQSMDVAAVLKDCESMHRRLRSIESAMGSMQQLLAA